MYISISICVFMCATMPHLYVDSRKHREGFLVCLHTPQHLHRSYTPRRSLHRTSTPLTYTHQRSIPTPLTNAAPQHLHRSPTPPKHLHRSHTPSHSLHTPLADTTTSTPLTYTTPESLGGGAMRRWHVERPQILFVIDDPLVGFGVWRRWRVERPETSFPESTTLLWFWVGGGAGAWSILRILFLFVIDDPLVVLGGWRCWRVNQCLVPCPPGCVLGSHPLLQKDSRYASRLG